MGLPVPRELIDFIQTGGKFLVAGHKEPDGDCVGSQLALVSALRRLGKEAIPCSAGPFKRTEVQRYAGLFTAAPTAGQREGGRFIIVDCSSPSRTGDLEPFLQGLPGAAIDHHATGERPLEGPAFIDAEAPAVTLLVQKLIEALGLELLKEEAELLLFGLCTDTGFFRHVGSSGEEAFAAASRLIRAGGSPKAAFRAIHGGKSFNSRLLLGILLSRAQAYFEGKLILTTETYGDTQRFGLEGRDSDSLYQMLLSVAGVEAAVVIRQESPDNCTVGLRSTDRIDVARIAAVFGGGGHRNAAGLSVGGTIEDFLPRILEAFRQTFYDICHNS